MRFLAPYTRAMLRGSCHSKGHNSTSVQGFVRGSIQGSI